jgi:glycosyltransferase involved in cell wall biosynthesis
MTRFCLIGPTYPYRGGIAHYTTLLAQHLREEYETLLISFSRQYPRWLFPGHSDRDPSERPLRTDAEYLLDPLNPLSWWQTLRRIQAWQPDVVVIPWWVPFWAPAWAVLGRGVKRLRPRPRLLFICHNVLPHEIGPVMRRVLPFGLRLALAAGDGFVVHAQSEARKLRHFLPQANIQVSPHPTYAALTEATTALPMALPTDRPLLLFCGLIRPYKGLDVLLEALALVIRPCHLLVAGEFWQGGRELHQAQIERLQLETRVTMIDEYLPNEILAACIQRADVVVLPYRQATQSGILQLAFGQGKPVITTTVGGLVEVVQHNETGLLVPPENPQRLAAAIDRFFDEELGGLFAENLGRENGRFAWSHLIETLIQLSGANHA